MSKNEDTSSSSDDEITNDAFREACDEKFLPQSLYATKDSSIPEFEIQAKEKVKPSLRVLENFDKFESFGVSQSFKSHVAKKLDALLDRSIVDRGTNDSEEEVPKKRKKKNRGMREKRSKSETGIKLMSCSSEILTKVEEPKDDEQRRIIKPWKFTRESESRNMIKCQEVAVDSNWILSMNETEAWSERRKGAVFKYKRGSDGALTEQN